MHVERWLSRASDLPSPPSEPFHVSLIYSATNAEELIFRKEIEAIAARHAEHVDATVSTDAWGSCAP